MARTPALESIVDATRDYEAWVACQVPLVRADIEFKHLQMARAPFPFLRATFYRWVQQWRASCADLARAPKVLAVGDLHTENFGTWRDTEGRLIWGINDFDEAFPLAYAIDLVRLATSARLAIRVATLRLTPGTACDAILRGYRAGMESGGRPFVLAEEHEVLRREAESELRNPVAFWSGLVGLAAVRRPPAKAVALLRGAVHAAERPRYVARRAGLGSLGHPRIVAIADQAGGHVAREAKALVGSAAGCAKTPRRSRNLSTGPSSKARSAAPIPSSRCATGGWYAASPPTAAGSSSPSRAPRKTRRSCSSPWAPRPPTSTWVRGSAGLPRCEPTSRGASRDGSRSRQE
jgi:Uncharacterized protein conserved in bacteria (DUF2252)